MDSLDSSIYGVSHLVSGTDSCGRIGRAILVFGLSTQAEG